MSKRQLEFFAILIWVAVVTAAAILIIDFQIKGSILDQATRFRQLYEESMKGTRDASYGQAGTRPASERADYHRGNDGPYPSDMVASGNPVMEKTGPNRNGYEPGSAGTGRSPKWQTAPNPSGIPPESE